MAPNAPTPRPYGDDALSQDPLRPPELLGAQHRLVLWGEQGISYLAWAAW